MTGPFSFQGLAGGDKTAGAHKEIDRQQAVAYIQTAGPDSGLLYRDRGAGRCRLTAAGRNCIMETADQKKKQALLITENAANALHARSVLGKYGIIINTEYESLSSVNVIRMSFKETRNTIFIRKSFSRMVGEWGPPFLVILDYRIDLGPVSVNDSDRRKLLRTFFISLVIMMKSGQLDSALVHFILLTDNKDFTEAMAFHKNPAAILDILQSENQEINTLITGIRQSPADFNRIFRILALPCSAFEGSFEKAIIAMTKEKAAAPPVPAQKMEPGAAASSPALPQAQPKKNGSADPPVAHVVYRVNETLAFVDGIQVSVEDKPSIRSLQTGQLHVLGRWEYRNQAEVTKMLGDLINNGIGGKRFGKNDEIIINLSSKCAIDTTVIASLVMLFTKQLAPYENKKIVVGFSAADILEKGSGYILIKKYVQHSY